MIVNITVYTTAWCARARPFSCRLLTLDSLPWFVEREYSGAVVKPPIQALMLTFLAEWGDRSQIATISLAVRGPRVV